KLDAGVHALGPEAALVEAERRVRRGLRRIDVRIELFARTGRMKEVEDAVAERDAAVVAELETEVGARLGQYGELVVAIEADVARLGEEADRCRGAVDAGAAADVHALVVAADGELAPQIDEEAAVVQLHLHAELPTQEAIVRADAVEQHRDV